MVKVVDMLFSRIDKVFAWARSAKTLSQNVIRGLVVLLILLLIALTFSVYGVILLLIPRISTLFILGLTVLFFWSIISTFILKKVKQATWKRLDFCSWFLFITYLSLFASGGIFGLLPPSVGRYIFPAKSELPLGDADGIAVGGSGNIYLAVPVYQRVQVYNRNGDFLKGLHVDTHGGAFCIWTENELLHVFISRTEKYLIMDSGGRVSESSEIHSFEEKESLWEKASANRFKDASGNTYIFHDSKWFPKVTKTNPSGKTVALISNPIHFWLLKGPLPAWLFGLFSMLMIGFLKLRKIKYKYLVDLEIKSKPAPELDFGKQ